MQTQHFFSNNISHKFNVILSYTCIFFASLISIFHIQVRFAHTAINAYFFEIGVFKSWIRVIESENEFAPEAPLVILVEQGRFGMAHV